MYSIPLKQTSIKTNRDHSSEKDANLTIHMPLIQYQFTPFLNIEYECTANNTSYAFFKIKSSVHFLAKTQIKLT